MASSNTKLTITSGNGVVVHNFSSPEEVYEFFKARIHGGSQPAPAVQQSVLLSGPSIAAKVTPVAAPAVSAAPAAAAPAAVPIAVPAEPAADLQMSNIFREDIPYDGTCVYYGYGNFIGKCKMNADRTTVVPAGHGRFDVASFRVANPDVKFTLIEGVFDAKSVKGAIVHFRRGSDSYVFNGSLKGLSLDEGVLTNKTTNITFTGAFNGVNFQTGMIATEFWTLRGANLNIPYYEVSEDVSILEAIGGRNSKVTFKNSLTNSEIEFTTDADGNRQHFHERNGEIDYSGAGRLGFANSGDMHVIRNGYGTCTVLATGQQLRGQFKDDHFESGNIVIGKETIAVRAMVGDFGPMLMVVSDTLQEYI